MLRNCNRKALLYNNKIQQKFLGQHRKIHG